MQIAMLYGAWVSQLHPPFDIPGLYKTYGLTGSESSFFNTARGLVERGHKVVAFCKCEGQAEIDGVAVLPLEMREGLHQLPADAVLTWNEPAELAFAPEGALRICAQQLNDFSYPTARDYMHLVDLFVLPSENHREYLIREQGLEAARGVVIPNSINLEHFEDPPHIAPDPKRVIWCSSPDRGLHHLLSFWPEIKKREPAATLRIFYRIRAWIEQMKHENFPSVQENARRARFIDHALRQLEGPRWGVEVMDNVPNIRMAQELREAAVLAYTCDPMRYTEGFGVSVLDAAAAGCLPIISDMDAMPEVHGKAALIIPGRPGERRKEWVDAIVDGLRGPEQRARLAAGMAEHARSHSRQVVSERWEKVIEAGLMTMGMMRSAKPGDVLELPPEGSKPPTFQEFVAERYENELHDDWLAAARPKEGHVCQRFWVDDRVMVGGSINSREDWLHLVNDFGIGACLSVESEHADGAKIEGYPAIYLPLPDDGLKKPTEWWFGCIGFAASVLSDPLRKLYVHCQVGGSRSPAVAYAILRSALKLSKLTAIERIKRSIPHYGTHPANVAYLESCEDALAVLADLATCKECGGEIALCRQCQAEYDRK